MATKFLYGTFVPANSNGELVVGKPVFTDDLSSPNEFYFAVLDRQKKFVGFDIVRYMSVEPAKASELHDIFTGMDFVRFNPQQNHTPITSRYTKIFELNINPGDSWSDKGLTVGYAKNGFYVVNGDVKVEEFKKLFNYLP